MYPHRPNGVIGYLHLVAILLHIKSKSEVKMSGGALAGIDTSNIVKDAPKVFRRL